LSTTVLPYEPIKQKVIEQLQKNWHGVLATAEGKHVTAREMMLIYDGLKISCFTAINMRKYKQIQANNNVAIAVDNIQIDGVATLKGHPGEPENAGFLKAFEESQPNIYEIFRDSCHNPEVPFRMIEIMPKRIALYYGYPDRHMEILIIDEQRGFRYDDSDGWATYE
jgi:uncharacterized pyridoxamine 5'-phosphate oxidase family protein